MAVSQHGPNAETYEAAAPGEGNGTMRKRCLAADGGWGLETRVSPLTPKNASRLPQLLGRPDGPAVKVRGRAAGRVSRRPREVLNG